MKIIDNKKDYYDYLASIYGIDDLVVYDRRGSVSLNSEKYLLHGMEYYFSYNLLPLDKPLSEKKYWSMKSIFIQREAKAVKHKFNKTFKEGDVYHFILEVGYTHYRFEVERWKDEKIPNFAHVETALLDTIKDVHQRYLEVPICIIPCQAQYFRWSHEERWEEIKNSLTHRVEKPILADTIITKMIPPTDIWQALYEYLPSLKDKPFTDTRSHRWSNTPERMTPTALTRMPHIISHSRTTSINNKGTPTQIISSFFIYYKLKHKKGQNMDILDLFFGAGPAVHTIMKLGFMLKDEDFLELTTEQYQQFFEKEGYTDEKVYALLPKDPQHYVPSDFNELNICTESDIATMKRVWQIVENYAF